MSVQEVKNAPVINLPDGSQRPIEPGWTAADLAKSIAEGLYRKSVGAIINDELRDLFTPLNDGDTVRILKPEDKESIELLRHSSAHVMAQAVQNLFPKAKIAIGPTIDDGFYYDFDIPDHKLTPEDLDKIELEMKKSPTPIKDWCASIFQTWTNSSRNSRIKARSTKPSCLKNTETTSQRSISCRTRTARRSGTISAAVLTCLPLII